MPKKAWVLFQSNSDSIRKDALCGLPKTCFFGEVKQNMMLKTNCLESTWDKTRVVSHKPKGYWLLRLSVGVLTACKLIETEIQSGSWEAIKTSQWWQKYPNISTHYQYQIQYPINIVGAIKTSYCWQKYTKISNQYHIQYPIRIMGGNKDIRLGAKHRLSALCRRANNGWWKRPDREAGTALFFLHLCKII